MKTPHLNALRALEAALRLGSFARAADELGVTPAAVGQQVRVLEDYLQCPLFDRRPGGVVPTAEAARVAATLTGGFSALEGALTELTARSEPHRIWITMTEDIAEHWIPEQLPGFLAHHPGVDLRLDGTSSIRTLGPSGFDFAVRSMPLSAVPETGAPLYPNREVPVCAEDFAARYRLDHNTRSLAGVPLCSVTIPGRDPVEVGWSAWCRANGFAWDDADRSSAVEQTGGSVRMARAGLALSLASLHSSRRALADGRLVMPFGPGREPDHDYWYVLLWPSGRRLSPAQRAFRDHIVAAARADLDAFADPSG